MIARAPTRCGSRSIIHGGPCGDDQRVVAPGGFNNAHHSDALPGVGVAHLRKSEDHQIGGVEVKEKKDRVDDALNATRATVDPTAADYGL
jgi:hypothetical protein